MLSRLTIRAKILGLIIGLVGVFAGMAAYLLVQLSAVDGSYATMFEHEVRLMQRTERARGDLANAGRQFNNVLLLQDPAGLPALRDSIRSIMDLVNARLAEAEALATGVTREEIARARATLARVEEMAPRLYALKQQGDHAGASGLYAREGRPVVVGTFNALAATVDRIAGAVEAHSVAIGAETMKVQWVALVLLGLVLLASLAAGAAVAILGVTRPLAGLSGRMATLAAGDTVAEVPGTGRGDELGGMARALLGFRDGLAAAERQRGEQRAAEARAEAEKRAAVLRLADGVEASIGGVTQSLEAASATLSGSTATLARIADGTLEQAGAAASGATEASANVQTVAAAAEELAASVAEISRQVTQSSQMAGRATEVAQRTDATVRALAEGAGKIGAVVRMIAGIAGQTNLLALNATIEAARAGEAGKGFAVVASEVKTLAAQTAKATDDISSQVSAIQAATGDAVEAINGIAAAIAEVNQITASIAAAVEQQGAATQEIARNVQQAAQGTNDVSNSMQMVSQGTTESNGALRQVDAAARGVASQTGTLRAELGGLLQRLRAA